MTIQLVPIGLMTHPCTTLSLLVSSLHTAWEGSDLSVVSIIYTVADLYIAQHIELITVLMKVYEMKQFAVLSKTAPQNVIHSGWCKCVQILLHHINIKQLRVYYYLELMHTRQSFNYSIETRTLHPELRVRVRSASETVSQVEAKCISFHSRIIMANICTIDTTGIYI